MANDLNIARPSAALTTAMKREPSPMGVAASWSTGVKGQTEELGTGEQQVQPPCCGEGLACGRHESCLLQSVWAKLRTRMLLNEAGGGGQVPQDPESHGDLYQVTAVDVLMYVKDVGFPSASATPF